MRITAPLARALPSWPPLLATRGPGARSDRHAHHAMHLLLADRGLRVRTTGGWIEAAGVLTAPDVAHEIDATGTDVLLVFIDPESDVGEALRPTIAGPVRTVSDDERDALREADPLQLMQGGGTAWTARVVEVLGGAQLPPRPPLHPKVKKLLRSLRAMDADADTSLPALAAAVELSPGRLMHAFSESIGLPLRPYLAWLRLQRAAALIVGGAPLAQAAVDAGFSDAAHMTRTFRKMLGMPPSMLMPASSFKTPAAPRRTSRA
jgi:AraC-like DNA-binding protein